MKKYLLLLFVPLAFWACSKSSDPAPAPELATPLVGIYNLTYIRYDSATYSQEVTLPRSSGSVTQSAIITVRRDSASVIYANYTVKTTGRADATDIFLDTGQLKVSGTTSPYNLVTTGSKIYPNGTKVGTADGTNFNLDFSYTVGGIKYREVYTGRK